MRPERQACDSDDWAGVLKGFMHDQSIMGARELAAHLGEDPNEMFEMVRGSLIPDRDRKVRMIKEMVRIEAMKAAAEIEAGR